MTRSPSIEPRLRARLRRELAYQALESRLFDGMAPEQLAYARDTSQRIAALCTRRAGKSRTIIRRLVLKALRQRGARVVYINETRAECERIAWHGVNGDGLVPLVESLGIQARFDNTKLRVTFDDIGSQIQLVGADDERAIQKLRGGAYHEVTIDEAQKMPHLRQFCDGVIGPALLDFKGTLSLEGTPSKSTIGLFYEVTSDGAPPGSWSVHRWSCLDNPHFGATQVERYERTVAEYLRQTGKALDHPDVRREFFREWVQEDATYVYPVHAVKDIAYAPARRNAVGGIDWAAALRDLPLRSDGKPYQWLHVVGADLGYDPDPFAVVAWSWTRDLPGLWELGSWSQTKLQPDAQAEVLMGIDQLLNPVDMVADAGGIGKGLVAGWSKGWLERAPLPIAEAEKSQKLTNIEWFGNDIRKGLVHVREGGAWLAEARQHLWLTTGTGKLVENPKTPNHCLDAGLYAFRSASHYRSETPPAPVVFGTPEYFAVEEQRMEEAIDAQIDDQDTW